MSRVVNYAAVWISILIVFSYLVLFQQVKYTYSKFWADWLALIGLSFMSASTFPVAAKAIANGIQTDRDRFLVSYWLIWTWVLIHRIWIIVLGLVKAKYAAYYDLFSMSPVSGLIAIGFFISAGFGGIAPFSSDTTMPRREVIIFSVAAGFSGIIAGIAIGVFWIAGWVD